MSSSNFHPKKEASNYATYVSHLLSTPPKIWLVCSFALCLITSWITNLQVEISFFCVSRVYQTKVSLQMPRRGGGVLLGILGGGVQPGSSNPDPLRPLQTKKCNLPQPFSHQTSKNPYPFSDLIFRQKLFNHYLAGRKQKNSSNPFQIRIFLPPFFELTHSSR